MKLSVFTVGMPEYGIEETVKILKEIGYNGVEWRVTTPAPEEKPENYSFEGRYWSYNKSTLDVNNIEAQALEAKAACDKYGMEICSLTSYFGCSEIGGIERVLKAANSIDCKMIRVNAPRYDGTENYNTVLNNAKQNIKEIEVLAKKYNVKVNFEIHMGNIIPSASAAYRLVSDFDPKYIGIIFDPGNMVHEGFENYKMGIELLGDYLAHVHIKNARWKLMDATAEGIEKWVPTWATVKKGYANLEKLISDLKACGYDGYLSMEDFSNEQGTLDKLKDNYNYIKGLMAK